MQDLACTLGRDAGKQGQVRVAIVAARQEQLAMLAREAVTMLPYLADGHAQSGPGIFASDDANGRVTLLLSGDTAPPAPAAGAQPRPSAQSCCDALSGYLALAGLTGGERDRCGRPAR